MALIAVAENERQYLLWWARANNAPAWFIEALERPVHQDLNVTYWQGVSDAEVRLPAVRSDK